MYSIFKYGRSAFQKMNKGGDFFGAGNLKYIL